MRRAIWLAGVMAIGVAAGAKAQEISDADRTRIMAELKEADDRYGATQAAGDLKAFAELLSEDYLYIDISGNRVTKATLLDRREGDKRVPVEMKSSEQEMTILAPTVVLQRGREDVLDEYFGGLPRWGSTRFSALWVKEADGKWRVRGEQVTRLNQPKEGASVRVTVDPAAVARLAGSYTLATRKPLMLQLTAQGDTLRATIPDGFKDMVFYPAAPDRFFAAERDFELRFAPDATGLTFVSWGNDTAAKRVR